MGSLSPSEAQLTDHQVEKVLVCFLREVYSGNLRLIDQRGWENFEVLRVSSKARQRWGLDMCMQLLYRANCNIKDKLALNDGREATPDNNVAKLPSTPSPGTNSIKRLFQRY